MLVNPLILNTDHFLLPRYLVFCIIYYFHIIYSGYTRECHEIFSGLIFNVRRFDGDKTNRL